MPTSRDATQDHKLQRFYQWHARIYDATRWSFLFGRRVLLQQVARLITPRRILEVGCGTGTNLRTLAICFPQAQLTGVDLSADMLAVAQCKLAAYAQRLNLQQQAYAAPLPENFDLIVFSYSLSMMNPGWEEALDAAQQNLSRDGVLAVVDFADTRSVLFRRWMGVNHVRMDGHLLPSLKQQFTRVFSQQPSVYMGLWRYLVFIGTNSPNAG